MSLQSELQAAVDRASAASLKLHAVIHGDAITTVETENGPIKTIAKAISDIETEFAAANVLAAVAADREAAEGAQNEAEIARDQAQTAAASINTTNLLAKGENLNDLPDKPAARNHLGLGSAATKDLGTTADTVAAGDHTHVDLIAKDQTARDIAISAYIKADVANSDPAGVYGRVMSDDFEADTLATKTNAYYDGSGKYYHNTVDTSATKVGFNGSSGYATFTPHPSLNSGMPSFTVSALVQLDAAGTQVIWGIGDMYMQTSGAWFYLAGAAGNVSLSAGLTTGVQYHLLITHSGGQINTTNTKLYVNGAVQSTSQYPATNFTANATGVIGKYPNSSGGYWNGKISKLAVWNTVLSAGEVTALYNNGSLLTPTANSGNYLSSSTLVHYFPMNEGAGSTLDDTQNATNGTLFGGYTWLNDLCPTMTSNTAPSGTVSASTEYGGTFDAWRALNDAGGNWSTTVGNTTGWWAYEFSSAKVVGKISMMGGGGDGVTANPKDFTFDYWNGASWVALLTVANFTSWVNNTNYTWDITSPVSAAKYRVNVTANNGNANFLNIREMQMMPPTAVGDMTLIPTTSTLSVEPNDAAIYILKQNIDAVSEGTDFKVFASIDGGASFTLASLTTVGNFGASDKLIRAEADVSAQTGTSFKWKITTHNAKSQRIKQITGYVA